MLLAVVDALRRLISLLKLQEIVRPSMRRVYEVKAMGVLFKLRIRTENRRHEKWYHKRTDNLGGYDSKYSATCDIARFDEWLRKNPGKGISDFSKTTGNKRDAPTWVNY